MQTTEVFPETARWLRYAEEDLITAETLLAQTGFLIFFRAGIYIIRVSNSI